MELTKRKLEYDYAKGIGVILVILGHMTTYPRIFRTAIYSFHMPLFFFLSGMLIEERGNEEIPFKEYFRKKLNLLKAAFFFESINCCWGIFKKILENDFSLQDMSYQLCGMFCQIGYSDFRGSLWFLFAYFLAILLFYPCRKLSRYRTFLLGVLLLVTSYACSSLFPSLYLPWHIEIVPACLGYILLGKSIKKVYDLLKKNLTQLALMWGGGLAYS